jgi:ABC-type Na+ transport system ATPase subunit NatA
VAVIDRGRIAAEGTPAEIKAQTKTSGLEDAFLAIMRESGNAPEEVLQ